MISPTALVDGLSSGKKDRRGRSFSFRLPEPLGGIGENEKRREVDERSIVEASRALCMTS
eukprot:scaffold212_cov160-Isochrysis_galbana.AAC.1